MKKLYTGKSVQEAIHKGLEDLGLEVGDAQINIVDHGSRGLFGIGSKDAKIEILLEGGQQSAPNPPTERTAPPKRPARTPAQREKPPAKEPSPEQHTEYIRHIREFLEGLIQRMGIQAELDIQEKADSILVNIKTEQTGKLIGYRGETLDAIQYITRLSLYKNDMAYKSVIVQTENYREKREKTLENLASRLADKCQKTKKKIVLEPMKPYERRIIHATLQDHPSVTTWSEGDEPKRQVVIAPKQ